MTGRKEVERMKVSMFNKTKKLLLAGATFVATALFAVLFATLPVSVKTDAATLASTEYQTDGASVRVFKKTSDGALEDTDKQGIRFHIEMGKDYAYEGTTLLDINDKTTNPNGAYKLADGFKTYTLVIPTRLLEGDLTVDTPQVRKIDTSGYWYEDSDRNLEAVAYIHGIPENRYTETFSFCGVICTVAEDGTETVVASTDTAERSVTYVAKQAYIDTIDENSNYWGSAEKDNTAAPLIKKFIPTYEVAYTVGSTTTTETVMWGDAPKDVPSNPNNAWYDESNNTEIDVTQPMTYANSGAVKLVATDSSEFVLTGVADYDGFEYDGKTYNGAKIYATIHSDAFIEEKTTLDHHAVNVDYVSTNGGTFSGLQGVWAMKETGANGQTQMRLFFAFDSSTMKSGDKLTITGDSVFYANGVMYKLTEAYTIDYTVVGAAESYGIYLGSIYSADVEKIENCAEDSTPTDGNNAIDEWTIRVFFYDDILIDDYFTFEHESEETPVYIKRGETIIPIEGGQYFWLDGQFKILELMGSGDYKNNLNGRSGDELHLAAGTIFKQNGGYYVLEDAAFSYFNGERWTIGESIGSYGASEFSLIGSKEENREEDGTITKEIRLDTQTHWTANLPTEGIPEAEQRNYLVNIFKSEKKDATAPYAVYHTAVDGTVSEIKDFVFHGQAIAEAPGTYYQKFGIRGFNGVEEGETVTIAKDTLFWIGSYYVTITEKITYYFTGSFWVQNYDPSTMGELSAASFGDRAHNQIGYNGTGAVTSEEVRLYFTAPLAGYTETDGGAFDELRLGVGSITLNGEPFPSFRYQRWDAGSTWLVAFGMAGHVALGDRLTIAQGTTIWSGKTAYRFTETVEWIYAGENGGNVTWSKVIGGVDVNATTTNASIVGSGTFEKGQTYTITVTPDSGYKVSKVTINGKTVDLVASNVYTFTVQAQNTVVVETLKGYNVTFTVAEGIQVNNGEITNGEIVAVVSGDDLTFTVKADTGYRIGSVVGATGSNGTYTVSNVTSDTQVTIASVKQWQVNFSGENASITAKVDNAAITNGAWVDNGKTATFTVTANSGYTLVSVTGATDNGNGTYTATVNGASLTVTATTVKTDSMTDITDMLSIENWSGAQDGEDNKWFVIKQSRLDEYMIPTAKMQPTGDAGSIYWNDHPEMAQYNYGVDIMEYIHIDGVSIRSLVKQNESNRQYTGTTFPFNVGGIYAPVTLEMGKSDSAGLWMRVMNDFKSTFNITVKAGFIFVCENAVYYVSKDVTFIYNGSVVGSQYSNVTDITTEYASVSGITKGQELVFGTTYNFTASANSGYQLTSVKFNGAELGTGGSYSFEANGQDVSITVTAKKLYTVTATTSNGVTVDAASKQVVEGGEVTFTITKPDGATIKVNGEEYNDSTYTVSNVTKDTTVVFTTWYTVSVTSLSKASVTVDGVNRDQGWSELREANTSISVTATANDNYGLKSVKIGGVEKGTSGTYNNITISGATAIEVVAANYTITFSCTRANVSNIKDKDSPENSYTLSNNQVTIPYGRTITFTATASNDNLESITVSSGTGEVSPNSSSAQSVTCEYTTDTYDNATITITGNNTSCVTGDTLITLADGTHKRADMLDGTEMLLVWNHFTGKMEAAPIAYIVDHGGVEKEEVVMRLNFSNGLYLDVIGEHVFYDVTLNKYVAITLENVEEFIGHSFATSNETNDGLNIVQLVSAENQLRVTTVYEVVTYKNITCFTGGILSASAYLDPLLNHFDINDETFAFDVEAMQFDVETYGLYTYADFENLISEEAFELYNAQYLKIAVGKGYITWEDILEMIDIYFGVEVEPLQ